MDVVTAYFLVHNSDRRTYFVFGRMNHAKPWDVIFRKGILAPF
jgi:hypothetical protein